MPQGINQLKAYFYLSHFVLGESRAVPYNDTECSFLHARPLTMGDRRPGLMTNSAMNERQLGLFAGLAMGERRPECLLAPFSLVLCMRCSKTLTSRYI